MCIKRLTNKPDLRTVNTINYCKMQKILRVVLLASSSYTPEQNKCKVDKYNYNNDYIRLFYQTYLLLF